MPYIGVSPQFGVRRKHTYTATASQTSFSGAGSEGATLSYTDSNFVDVYQNGVKLGDADYTSTSGTAIVLAQGASVDDLIEIIVFDAFSAADTVSKADGGQFDGNVTMAGTLGVTGNQTNSGNLTVSGAFTSQGIDDNANATAITIDSSENVMINTTNTNPAEGNVAGVSLMASNAISACDDGSAPIQLNRKTNDGAIAIFRKDGSAVGQINADGGRLLIASTNAGLRFDSSNSAIFPRKSDNTTSDNAIGLGLAGHRFTSLYLSDGVYVSGTADGNKLDNYDEGTWTPVLSDGSSSLTLGVAVAFYTRIGNSVHAEFYIQRTDSASNTATMILQGLPFAHKAIPAIVGQCWIDNTSSSDIRCFLYLPTSYQQLYFVKAGASSSYVSLNEFENNRYIYGAFDYLV